jgi:hypothetical protein
MDLTLGIQVLCYLTGRVTSLVGAYVITAIISWNPSLEFGRMLNQYRGVLD